ncbi:MAG: DUF1289 domain-containing protein [Pseudomonadota bacterium]
MTVTITSPCTGVCKLDDATGWCLGCGRNGDEIADWRTKSEDWRANVWEQIPERLSQLGIAYRRLPWTTERIQEFVVQSCEQNQGTWVMGVVGAVAEFTAPPTIRIEVVTQGDDLIAQTINGAMRMVINDDVRALTFDPPEAKVQPRIILAVKRERAQLPVANGVTDLGEDSKALLGEAGTQLFDLGLGRKEARFCVRVENGTARTAVENAIGLEFKDALPRIGAALISESPTRVVESALGRIEVQGQILTPRAASPHGPHTHLLLDYLATDRALPVGMDIPRAYLPGAIFYPKR